MKISPPCVNIYDAFLMKMYFPKNNLKNGIALYFYKSNIWFNRRVWDCHFASAYSTEQSQEDENKNGK